jgi:type II secretory pathway pseudopilin PulG
VRTRVSNEEGFGVLELVIAIVLLNVGLLALLGTFASGTVSIRRAAATSNGTAVADKAMEVYRGMKNDAIYLKASGTGADQASGYPDGIPAATSAWYTKYVNDSGAYTGSTMFSYPTPTSTPLWITDTSSFVPASYSPLPATVTTDIPTGLPTDPKQAVQAVIGPDGQAYPVLTYIIAVQPGTSGGYVKRVTIDVLNPRNTTQIIARESSLFDPNAVG